MKGGRVGWDRSQRRVTCATARSHPGIPTEGAGVRHLDRGRESLGVLLLSLQLSCGGGYDPSMLEKPELCGDGNVDKGELCDIEIPPGRIGACPTECAPAGA